MTEAELEILRLKMRLEVHQVLLHMLYTGLANSSPTVGPALRERFARLREKHGKITIPGIAPEYSDLVSAEYQEALDDALSYIEKGFH